MGSASTLNNLHLVEQGNGAISNDEHGWTLEIPSAEKAQYSNAMLTSYRARSDFSFAPQTRLEMTAHIEGTLHGTAGFGFWNHPYGLGMRLPRAIWFFFSSPPNKMPLAMNVPGQGFKATVFDAQRWLFYILLPTVPISMLLMRVPLLYRMFWPVGQRAIGVDEKLLDATLLQTPRRYSIDWQAERVEFSVDGEKIFTTRRVPLGKLGFVAWIDNQYAVVTPQGSFGFGVVDVPNRQRLVIEDVSLTTG